MYHFFAPAVGLVLGWALLVSRSFENTCRCRPWEPCWPTQEKWASLNSSIQGNLVRLEPVGAVCHEPKFDRYACDALQDLALDSGWRASQPATLQDWVWESGSHLNETCPIVVASDNQSTETTCHQGRISLYSAAVKSVAHVQTAVIFAKKHNLRLVIKNTGHDGSPNSLQIHTTNLKKIEYHTSFTAQGTSESSGPAVTVGAGIMHWEIYKHGAKHGYHVVGGECPTVGMAGGFLQGGGVSSFHSFTRGLAVDNVLEYKIVTSSGELITANEHQHKDLFWALKGGGGGTFGVVVEVTVRSYPDDPGVVSTVTVQSTRCDTSFWEFGISSLLKLLRSSNKGGIPGQLIVFPPGDEAQLATLTLYFINSTEIQKAEAFIEPHMKDLQRSKIVSSLSSKLRHRLSAEVRTAPDINPPNYGILEGAVLLSEEAFNSEEGPSRIAQVFAKLPMGKNDLLFSSNTGGRVVANNVDIPLHPAWRSSAHLINYVRGVEPSIDGKTLALNEMTNLYMPILYSMNSETRVSYRNLGDPNEKDFQNVYWGKDNYLRLLKIKNKFDPDELFITKLGVGSEAWDEEGMCKKSKLAMFDSLMLEKKFRRWIQVSS
ncbi:oxidoreductase [Penicillium macrosclerotiorum]|uniref:oxidoreductase n=1 Tax=Penicillium macrosclerotiorum TaxID=303699 RepID=UPI002549C10C|nr:oxidoreductase [Penicillium macrosclerotiorum]KAJ5689631.1 oxidoreductase [Penicillium macrosclerotiorum]